MTCRSIEIHPFLPNPLESLPFSSIEFDLHFLIAICALSRRWLSTSRMCVVSSKLFAPVDSLGNLGAVYVINFAN